MSCEDWPAGSRDVRSRGSDYDQWGGGWDAEGQRGQRGGGWDANCQSGQWGGGWESWESCHIEDQWEQRGPARSSEGTAIIDAPDNGRELHARLRELYCAAPDFDALAQDTAVAEPGWDALAPNTVVADGNVDWPVAGFLLGDQTAVAGTGAPNCLGDHTIQTTVVGADASEVLGDQTVFELEYFRQFEISRQLQATQCGPEVASPSGRVCGA